jgi:hypothetical protein
VRSKPTGRRAARRPVGIRHFLSVNSAGMVHRCAALGDFEVSLLVAGLTL